jgi:hypothetical protein
MKRRVILVLVATSLSLSVGCATSATSSHGPRHSDAEVHKALADAERSALTRLSDSVSLETAQAARRLALAGSR